MHGQSLYWIGIEKRPPYVAGSVQDSLMLFRYWYRVASAPKLASTQPEAA